MSFLSKLFGGGNDSAKIAELADEVDRYADRFQNSDDTESAAIARDYANRIREAKTLKNAQDLHAEFLAILEKLGKSEDEVHETSRRGRLYEEKEEVDDADTETWSDDS
jgi:hypothetical protein